MVYFRDYHWLPVHGYNQFEALINTECRKPDDVFWFINFRCVAGGAPWRRVAHYDRPSLWLEISGFKPKLRDWRDLESLKFWNWEEEDEETFCPAAPCGYFDVDFFPGRGTDQREHSFLNDAIWRVTGRDGGWFTVELAACADGRNVFGRLKDGVKVTVDGREEGPEPEAEFWKKNADLYLIEEIPFGTISVRTPRNVRNPEAYALRRAHELIGIDRPEHIVVRDHWKSSQRHHHECPETIRDDIFVELHFNGFYED